jgi:eukaryotic-like serine/threonine-protein kinase
MSDTAILSEGIPSHIRPGLVIGGKYRLEEEIGRGSMGTVYRAVHVTLGQRVAIKLISGEHLQSSEARKRFSVEAKAAAKLRSRHVVQVYDDGETPEGNPYIVLEYLEGETLEQRLEREHDLPLVDAVRIVAHVSRALARAHAQGIVHRDLKPANIFLVKSEDDEVGWIAKVLDFGIAKLDNQGEKGTTQAGTVLGTPLFMSPEQVRGASSVDHRADLYSLGMCLFHMLTGDYAYYSANYSDILIAICTLPLPSLREKSPWVPSTVEQWFQRACARERLERFQSADEMSEALQAAAGGMPLSKHQSFPEGRIAPETLVGYATPALATMHLDTGPASLARTQQVVGQPGAPYLPGTPYPPGGSAHAPIAIAIGGKSRGDISGARPPPKRGIPPLLLGAGLGLLVVALFTIGLTLWSGSDKARTGDSNVRAQASAAAPPPPTTASPIPEAPPPAPSPEPASMAPAVVSSVAAVTSTPRDSPLRKAAASTPPNRQPGQKAGSLVIPGQPSKPAATPAPAKSPASDLGF